MRPRIARYAYLLALCVIFLSSCAIQRPPIIQYRDSTVVEYRDRLVHDTVAFEVPVEVEKIVTRDTSSHLENSLAISDAVVSGGFLHHELRTKPQSIPVPVAIEVRDTSVTEKQSETQIQTVEVERKLNFWERFRIGAFWWLLALALVGWRREILALIRRFISI